jgi:phosphoribosylformylglycinamidine cyclo-ligase
VSESVELSYRSAGVDRDASNRAKERIIEMLAGTATAGVVPNPGGFGGLFRIPTGLQQGLLVASADSVGTKVKVASLADRHDTIGHDIVNHCANDILVEGARPLFFLDYLGMGRLVPGTAERVVAGVVAACAAAGCALLGGETAELPDMYAPGEYDLAGFIVGMVEESARPGGHRVREGDTLIGLASDGFHTNGYSLLRRLFFEKLGLGIHDLFPGMQASLADVLLRPHRAYGQALLPLLAEGRIHALAHVTGGGIPENLHRVIPDGLSARVETGSWTVPHEFRVVAEFGHVEAAEMFRTFNMGVGMVVVTPPAAAAEITKHLASAGETAWRLGVVTSGDRKVVLSGD